MGADTWQLGGLALGIALAMLGIAAWLKASELWRESGLPEGQVVSSDMGAWHRQSEPLVALDLRLSGRPDYLVETDRGELVPVEVKSTPAPPEPYSSHVLQLAAYCLLVQRNYGVRPSYGIVQYRDKAFAVDYTPALEGDVLDILTAMHGDLYAPDVGRDHDDERRCARCGVRAYCEDRLA